MRVRLDYGQTQALLFLAACTAVGAVGGLLYGLVRKGER